MRALRMRWPAGRSSADIALSVTGVSGPTPDEDGNPPGDVYFGLVRRGHESRVVSRQFTEKDPHVARRAVVLHALELLRDVAS